MTLPSNLQTITVHGTFLDSTGAPLSGSLSFAPNCELVDLNNAALYPTPLVVTLDMSGTFSTTLICTDNPTLYPTGWSYTVTESVRTPRSYPISLPHGLGSTVDLSALMPIPLLPGQTSVPVVGSQPTYAQLSYAQTWTAAQVFQGGASGPTPVNAGDYVTKSYADAIALGLSVKYSVQESTTGPLPANTYASGVLTASGNGALTVDGIAVAAGDRVLVMNEATAANNGIYTVVSAGGSTTAYALQRSSDMSTAAEIPGAFTFVEQGTANAGAGYVVASKGPFTIGTTAITWTQVSGSGLTYGTGLTLTGKVLSLSAPVPVNLGGTGQTSLQAYLDALAGAVTAGQYLRGNGSHIQLAAIAAADLPAASNSTPGAVEFAASAGVLQAAGVAALGSTGTVPDAGHVHPTAPWQFSPSSYGAKGDGQMVTDGAITTGTNTLACTTSTPFKNSDVGKPIMIKGAGSATVTTLITTITGFTDSGHVTIAANAVTTATGALVMWSTDDTSAVQQAINAAFAYAAAHGVYAEIDLSSPTGVFFGVAGPLVTTVGGSTLWNSQLTIPVNSDHNAKITLTFKGAGNSGTTRHWNQLVPGVNPSTIVSFGVFASASAQTTSFSNSGNPSVLGGPTGKYGYGGSGQLYNNILINLENFTILTTHSSSGYNYCAVNLWGCATANISNFSTSSTGMVELTDGSNDFGSGTTFGGGASIGILLPGNGNNADTSLSHVTIGGGYTYGLFATEHMSGKAITILYCWAGLCPVGIYGDGGSGIGGQHGVFVDQCCIEACLYHVCFVGVGTVGPTLHAILDTEGTVQFRDTTSGTALAAANGQVRMIGTSSTPTLTFPTPLRIIREQIAPGIGASPPALVANTAVCNTFYRHATIYLTGGTNLTTIQVSSLAGGASAPAVTTVADFTAAGTIAAPFPVRLGPGCWIKVNTSSGTAVPTAVWDLD